ncbi:MAG: hypothetical protein IJK77_00285 [Lachnospiraceae bacterium]|nr:hypothetical protein [Lachnospiraceae bacterium]
MDKYTYNVKAEKIQKLVKKGEYAAAVKIAETVDWEEVHSVRLLTITAAAYERIRDYKGAIELLQMAYDESAVGKRILYKLTGLAIADRDVELAQNYYEMYLQEAPEENGRYLLRYLLAELKGESLDKRIAILETYRKYEFEEEWALRLAELYDEAGLGDACVKLCDEIILWFSVGEYVDAALKLKGKYAPLSAEQQDKLDNREFYEQRYQEVAAEYREKDKAVEEPAADGSGSEDEEPEDETEQAEEKPAGGPLLPEPKSDAWRERILFVGADNLEQAVPQILGRLNAYHEKAGTDMAVTRIPALKFNKLGLEASRPHISGKDLIVDGASALTDDLLRDILAYVKEADTATVFALTDTPTELAYLDNRLGAIIKEDELPEIDTGVPEASELKLDLDAVADDEPAVDLGGTTKEIVPQVKAALGENDESVLDERAAVSDTVKFDKGVVAEEAAVAAAAAAGLAAGAAETAAASESAVEAAAETAAEAVAEAAPVLPEPAVILPENDDDYRQETIEDFFKAQEEAAEKAEEKVEEKDEEVKAAVEETAEAAQQEVEAVIVAVEGKTNELGEALEEKTEEVREVVEEKTEEVREAVEEKAEEVKEAAEEKVEAAEAKAEEIKETAEETVEEEKEAAEEKVEAVETKAEEIKETVEEKVEEVKEAVEEKAESAKDILEEAKKAVEEKTEAAAETAAAAEVKAEEAFEDLGGAFEEVKETVEEKAEAVKEAVEKKTEAVEARAEEAAAAVGTAAGAAAAVAAKAEKEEREIVSEAFAKPEDEKEALRRRALSIPGSMVPESFVTYAKNYLTSIDCVLEEDGEEALMSAAEYRVAEGTALTKEEAENIIEAAADLSEKKGGLFARRYNKEGCLILKTKYIV